MNICSYCKKRKECDTDERNCFVLDNDCEEIVVAVDPICARIMEVNDDETMGNSKRNE